MTSAGFAASIEREEERSEAGCVLVCYSVRRLVTKAIEGEACIIERRTVVSGSGHEQWANCDGSSTWD